MEIERKENFNHDIGSYLSRDIQSFTFGHVTYDSNLVNGGSMCFLKSDRYMSLTYSFWTTIFALKIQVSHINRIELTASFSKLQLNNYLQTILNYNEVINCTLFLFSNKHLRIKITHWLFKSPKHATYVFVHFYLRHTPLNGETKITSFKSTRYFSCHFEKKLLSTSHQHLAGLEISNP